jgi:hypothetical protein
MLKNSRNGTYRNKIPCVIKELTNNSKVSGPEVPDIGLIRYLTKMNFAIKCATSRNTFK